MSFRYVKDERLIRETLDFAKIQEERANSIPDKHQVFTSAPKDTRIKYVPSYLLKEGQDPNGEHIVYTIDQSMPSALKITEENVE